MTTLLAWRYQNPHRLVVAHLSLLINCMTTQRSAHIVVAHLYIHFKLRNDPKFCPHSRDAFVIIFMANCATTKIQKHLCPMDVARLLHFVAICVTTEHNPSQNQSRGACAYSKLHDDLINLSQMSWRIALFKANCATIVSTFAKCRGACVLHIAWRPYLPNVVAHVH
jgi:hypothetical protein